LHLGLECAGIFDGKKQLQPNKYGRDQLFI
jgi:hypothetical protein